MTRVWTTVSRADGEVWGSKRRIMCPTFMDRVKPRRLLHEIYLKQPIPIHTLGNIFKYDGVLNHLLLHLISTRTYSWSGLSQNALGEH